MSTIENEAWVEAVALATLNDLRVSGGWPPLIEIPEGFQDADEWRAQARAAIRALAPLIIERCAEVAKRHAEEHVRSLGAYGAADVDSGRGRQEGHIDAGNTIAQIIRALNHFGDATEMVSTVTSRTVPIPEDDVVAAYRGLMVLATMCRKAGLAAGYETAVDIEKRLQKAHPALIGLAVLRSGDGHALIQKGDK